MDMGSLMTECMPFIFLLLLTHNGVHGDTWNVTYNSTYICALEGSTLNLSCSYRSKCKVKNKYWINQDSHIPVDLSKNNTYKHRVKVNCGESQCSLSMTKLTKQDAQYMYYFRIEGNCQERWIGIPGISVNVTDLQVVSTKRTNNVTKGDAITLTCNTTCKLTNSPSFIWSKDGHPVEENQIIYNQLQLHPVGSEDEGNYTCAVKGHEDLSSPPYRLNVQPGDQSAVMNVLIAVALCVAVAVLCAISWVWFRKRRKERKGEHVEQQRATSSDVLRADAAGGGGGGGAQDDGQYCNINFQSAGRGRAAAPPSGAEDDGHYSTIQPHSSGQTARGQEKDVQYTSVQFDENRGTMSPLGQPEGDTSVIYSHVS
ncbi:uncharacterized protein LOC134083369 [Sardina pilchardus]|uniref:uncharacterized protein LOC134083369 n=1 Tax=Sardina pilchardus TaxID=27697 RepID=UPI002E0E395A